MLLCGCGWDSSEKCICTLFTGNYYDEEERFRINGSVYKVNVMMYHPIVRGVFIYSL